MEIRMKLLEWEKKLEREKNWKRQKKRSRIVVGKKQPIQRNSNHWKHFVNKPLSNFDLEKWIDDLKIKHFRTIFFRDRLPDQIRKKECGIINLDSIEGEGTHWVCYRNLDENMTEYFDPFGLIMPHEIRHYLLTSGRVTPCVEPSGYQTDKNGRTQFFCHCPVCEIKKVRYVKSNQSGEKKA